MSWPTHKRAGSEARRRILVVTLAMIPACGEGKREAEPPASPPAGYSLVDLVPSDAQLMIGFRVASLRDSPLVKRSLRLLLARDEGLQRRVETLFSTCRFDPRRDLTELVLAIGDREEDVALIAAGGFVERDLTSCVSKAMSALGGMLTSKSRQGRTLYRAKTAGDGVWYAVVDSTLVVGSSEEWLHQALSSTQVPHAALLAGGDAAAGIWVVAGIPASLGESLQTALDVGLKAPPSALVAAVDLRDGLTAELGLQMADGQDAAAAAAKASPEIALSALAAQRFSLGPLVNRIRVEVEDQMLYLRITLTAAELNDVLTRLGQNRG